MSQVAYAIKFDGKIIVETVGRKKVMSAAAWLVIAHSMVPTRSTNEEEIFQVFEQHKTSEELITVKIEEIPDAEVQEETRRH